MYLLVATLCAHHGKYFCASFIGWYWVLLCFVIQSLLSYLFMHLAYVCCPSSLNEHVLGLLWNFSASSLDVGLYVSSPLLVEIMINSWSVLFKLLN